MMQTFADIITAFGGYAKVAEILECPPGTVSSWKSRNGIPPQHWVKLVNAASERGIAGITFAVLAEIASRQPASSLAEAS